MSVIPETGSTNGAVETPVNFDDFSLEDLRTALATGDVPAGSPATARPAEAPAASQAEEPPKIEEPKEPEAPKVEEPKVEVPEEPKAEEGFKFTENADPETFQKEKAAYLETVELTPELQHILDEQTKQYEAAQTQLTQAQTEKTEAIDEVAQAVTTALDKLLTFRQREDGKFVPDTSEFVRVIEQKFPQEAPQLVMDMVTMPSTKYVGQTRFQEFLRDGFGLDDQGMRNLEEFLDNGGRVTGPSIVPEGVDPKYAEAFWMSPDRTTLEDALAEQRSVLTDEYATDLQKQQAQQAIHGTLQAINSRLRLMQSGLDAEKYQKEQSTQLQQQQINQINESAQQSYINTATEMLRNFQTKIAENLTMFDGPGASVTALAYTTLIQQALSDNEWSKYAQTDLAAAGISFDWAKGRQVFERLAEIEQRIAYNTAMKANPRAIDLAKRDKSLTLKELKGLEVDLMGRIAKVAIAGSNKALETKVANAPKTPAVRPKVSQTGQTTTGTPSLDQLPLEQLRSLVGQERSRRREQGLPV